MRLSKVFSPFSNPIALVAADIGVTARAFYLARISTSLIIFLLFVVLGYSGTFLPFYFTLGSFFGYRVLAIEETALKLVLVFVFLNSFLGDAIVNFEKKAKKKQKENAILSFFEQVSDAVIIFGALVFLVLRESYYDFGRFFLLDLSYVEPKSEGHAILGIAALGGILFIKYAAASNKKELPLSVSAERTLWLGIFAFTGFYLGMFAGAVFAGILLVTASLYLSAIISYSSAKTYEVAIKLLAAFFNSIFSLIKKVLKSSRRAIGVLLLWVYYLFEGIFAKAGEIKSGFKRNVKLPKSQQPKPEKAGKEAAAEPKIEAVHRAEIEPGIKAGPVIEKSEPELLPKPHIEAKAEPENEFKGIYTGESLLVEYSPEDNKTAVLEYITGVVRRENRSAVLILTQPLTQQFKERAMPQNLKVVNLTTEHAAPTKEEISMTQLEYFSDIFDNLSEGGVIIFEPVSNLILNAGTAQAYKFISSTIEKLSQKSITFIAFINKSGHEKRDLSNFENLFMHLAEIKDNKLKKMK